MKIKHPNIILICFVCFAPLFERLGDLYFPYFPKIAMVLIYIGMFVAIWVSISSEYDRVEFNNQIDAMAGIMATKGFGNAYLERLKMEFNQKGSCSFKKTFSYLRAALTLNPNDLEALLMLAGFLTLNLSNKSWLNPKSNFKIPIIAIKELIRRGLKIDRKNPNWYIFLGMICDIEKKNIKARLFFKKASKYEDDAYWHLAMSTSYGMTKDYQKALEEVEIAIKMGAKGWPIDFYYGRALVSTGDYEKAVIYLKRAYDLNPNLPQILEYYQEAYYLQGFFMRAALLNLSLSTKYLFGSFKKFVRSSVEVLRILILWFICGLSKLAWKFSKRLYWLARIQLLILPPDEPERSLSEVMREKGHFKQEERLLRKAIEGCSINPSTLNNLAACLIRLGKKEEAIIVFNKARLIAPNNRIIKLNTPQFDTLSRQLNNN
jgi:tetratricopeptide (TPR) repeat protein